MRKLYIVAPGTPLAASVRQDAESAGATEIVEGVPPRLVRDGVSGIYPFVYTEPDDPEKEPVRLAAAVLINQLNRPEGTLRTAAQLNNALDAITVILRRVARNELDR